MNFYDLDRASLSHIFSYTYDPLFQMRIVCKKFLSIYLDPSLGVIVDCRNLRLSSVAWKNLFRQNESKVVCRLDLKASNCLEHANAIMLQKRTLIKTLSIDCFSTKQNFLGSQLLKNILSQTIGLLTLNLPDLSLDQTYIKSHYNYPFDARKNFPSVKNLTIAYQGNAKINVIKNIFPHLQNLHIYFCKVLEGTEYDIESASLREKMGFNELMYEMPQLKITITIKKIHYVKSQLTEKVHQLKLERALLCKEPVRSLPQ